jgi:hypothetical protein
MPESNKNKKKRPKRQRVKIETRRLVNKMTQPNYLKYYRITSYWAKRNYNISQAKLEILFFIYDIPIFTRTDFDDFSKMGSFHERNLMPLIKEGWVIKWRREGVNKHALYRISRQGKRLVTEFYKKLKGEQPFPESESKNVVMRGKTSTDKIMSKKMLEINAANRKKAANVVWVRGDE